MKIKQLYTTAIYEFGKRQNQEDTLFPVAGAATEDSRLFLVCDGMGGHEKGEVASQLVAETIATFMTAAQDRDEPAEHLVQQAVEAAFRQLDVAGADSQESKKMGTTLTMTYFHRGGCLMAYIGDSRIYHVRPSEHRILYKSRDHSLVYELFLAEEIAFEEMATHPKKNVITRAMMPGMDEPPMASIAQTTDIRAGDLFYLCSDGMLEQMSDEELLAVLCADSSLDEKKAILIEATKNNADNHSAYLIQVGQVEREEGDEDFPNDEQETRCNALRYEKKRPSSEPPSIQSTSSDSLSMPREVKHSASPQPCPVKPSSPMTKKMVAFFLFLFVLAFIIFLLFKLLDIL